MTKCSLVVDAQNTGISGAAEEWVTTIFQATKWFIFAATIIKTGVSVRVDAHHTDITGQTIPKGRRTIKAGPIHIVDETNAACFVIAALIGPIIINADVSTGMTRSVNTHSAAGALAIHVATDDATHLHFVFCVSVFYLTSTITGAVPVVSAFVAVVLGLFISFKKTIRAYTCIASRFTVVIKVLALAILTTAQRS